MRALKNIYGCSEMNKKKKFWLEMKILISRKLVKILISQNVELLGLILECFLPYRVLPCQLCRPGINFNNSFSWRLFQKARPFCNKNITFLLNSVLVYYRHKIWLVENWSQVVHLGTWRSRYRSRNSGIGSDVSAPAAVTVFYLISVNLVWFIKPWMSLVFHSPNKFVKSKLVRVYL